MPFLIEWIENCRGEVRREWLSTPVGVLDIMTQGEVILSLNWVVNPPFCTSEVSIQSAIAHSLGRYWQAPDANVSVKLFRQGSTYRHKVWAQLIAVPFGATCTYKDIAKNIASSPRAVGNACRDNPYPLIIPCHRIISLAGMGGYCGQMAGEFISIKQKLLAFERTHHAL